MVIHEHLRVPPQNAVHHDARLGLALCHEVAVHIEAEMVVAPGDAPRLVLLERPGVIGADRDGVVPGREALVPIRVGARVEHDDDVLENGPRHRVLAGQHLVGDLHRRFESGRLVAVHGVLEQRDDRLLGGDGIGAGGRRLARIGQLGDGGADRLELGEVRRVRDDQHAVGAELDRASPRFGAHAIGRGREQGIEIALHHGVHGLLVAGRVSRDLLGAGHVGAIGAARVEIERLRAQWLDQGQREGDANQKSGHRAGVKEW